MNRKRIIDLTTEDLLENQVWEYWMADNIEYVRASDKTEISEDSNVAFIVLTDFIFKNKTKHIGFCSPQETGSLDQIQPVILTKKGQVELYKESEWSESEKNKALSKLGFEEQDIFPIVYTTKVKCNWKLFTSSLTDFNAGI
jgi:hypothetical protein